jgi:molybdenum cofactor cytidylyltransferase
MIAVIVLAAGASKRFGEQKLVVPLAGKAVVRHAVERAMAAGADETIVVTGANGDDVRAALDGLAVRFVENPKFAEGMSTSLAAGIAALTPGTEAALIALGDQPLVPAEAYAAVLAEYRRARPPIVAPSYNGVRGHPVLFDAAVFPELVAARGDRGARGVISSDPRRVRYVELAMPVPVDVDSPAALAAISL